MRGQRRAGTVDDRRIVELNRRQIDRDTDVIGPVRRLFEGGLRIYTTFDPLAQEIGISGVPALVVSSGDKGYLVSGAQPFEIVQRVVETTLNEAEAVGEQPSRRVISR